MSSSFVDGAGVWIVAAMLRNLMAERCTRA
jgi:hypothetical protein